MPAPHGYSTATLDDFVGHDFGASAPVTIGQDRINGFADVTGDKQWIHVDVEHSRVESCCGSRRKRSRSAVHPYQWRTS
jgi:acyl dehydratase